MILDSSAIISILTEEDGHEALSSVLIAAPSVGIGMPTLFEAEMVLITREGVAGRLALAVFLEEHEVAAISFSKNHSHLATEAFLRFGKGRHPARLNYGDCMAYATARLADAPLLCVGSDFAKTDLRLALG